MDPNTVDATKGIIDCLAYLFFSHLCCLNQASFLFLCFFPFRYILFFFLKLFMFVQTYQHFFIGYAFIFPALRCWCSGTERRSLCFWWLWWEGLLDVRYHWFADQTAYYFEIMAAFRNDLFFGSVSLNLYVHIYMYELRDIFIRTYLYVFPRTTLVGAHPSHTCYM